MDNTGYIGQMGQVRRMNYVDCMNQLIVWVVGLIHKIHTVKKEMTWIHWSYKLICEPTGGV